VLWFRKSSILGLLAPPRAGGFRGFFLLVLLCFLRGFFLPWRPFRFFSHLEPLTSSHFSLEPPTRFALTAPPLCGKPDGGIRQPSLAPPLCGKPDGGIRQPSLSPPDGKPEGGIRQIPPVGRGTAGGIITNTSLLPSLVQASAAAAVSAVLSSCRLRGPIRPLMAANTARNKTKKDLMLLRFLSSLACCRHLHLFSSFSCLALAGRLTLIFLLCLLRLLVQGTF
jgi:hypothetical protein